MNRSHWPNRLSHRRASRAQVSSAFPSASSPATEEWANHRRLLTRRFSNAPGLLLLRLPRRHRWGRLSVPSASSWTPFSITALVIHRDGTSAGFQDKVQLDPSEESTYSPGSGRRVFQTGPLTFGIAICHEGWRYPETVRWAARHGAQVVFHPHFHQAEPGSYQPATFADPANSFHEKAALCRAAENTCYFATVNYASAGSPTTSAVVRPDGTLLSFQPYGQAGLLIADIDLDAANGLLASRCKSI